MTQNSDWPRLSILMLCDDRSDHANTILGHIAAFKTFSGHEVRIFNPLGMKASKYLDFDEFDVVVIHYSVVIISDHYLSPDFRERLRRFQGLKVQFIQDDYRWINEITTMMRYIGIHVLFTLVATPEIPKIWDETRLPGVVKLSTFAGYVPDSLVGFEIPPVEARPIDIGYRGRTLPYWLGQLAQEKAWIGQGVLARAERYKLCCDIGWAEEDRIYGQRWNRFLSSCRATLGTESGASITDFDGSIEKQTKAYLAEHRAADFYEVQREILQSHEGNVRMNVVSPRIFEAAALRTALILFPGEYSGVVHPWLHYIPLAKDFSNMDEVVDKLRNTEFVRAMVETVYQDLVASERYSLRSFVREFDKVVSRYGTAGTRRRKVRYQLSRLERLIALTGSTARASAKPYLRITQDLLKGLIALILMVSVPAGVKVLAHYLTVREFRKTVRFRQLLRDILKLAVVGQARAGLMMVKDRFKVSIDFDSRKGLIMIQSLPVESPGSEQCQRLVGIGPEPVRESFWPTLESAVREGRVRMMLWNHSALGGHARYAVTPFLWLTVRVGDNDIHSFDGLVELARSAPDRAWALLSPLLRAEQ